MVGEQDGGGGGEIGGLGKKTRMAAAAVERLADWGRKMTQLCTGK
jgi:hypothetical protein